MEPLVSIVVITYNSSKYVLETLESIKAQTYENIELIISDDCSTDTTVSLCRIWMNKNKVRFIRTELVTIEKNTGISANCNRGIKAARGEWIKLIAGDDALESDIIYKYINYLSDNQSIRVIHSNAKKYYDNFDEHNIIETTDLENLKINAENTTVDEQFQILLRTAPIMTSTTLVKKNVYDEVGLYDEKAAYWEDNPMWLKITKKGIKIFFINTVGAKYRIHQESVQSTKRDTQLFSPFKLTRDKYYKNNYLKELPLIERMLNGFLINRNIFMSNVTKNKRSFFPRVIMYVTGFLPNMVLSILEKKYLE
jgi:glycosyltransferase involved in cell wall biosynthesis